MKKQLFIIALFVLIISSIHGEIIDWGIDFGSTFSKNIGEDNVYSINYKVYQNLSFIDTTSPDSTVISDEILIGEYLLTSDVMEIKPSFSFGVFLRYKLSEGRNSFIFQPEVHWTRNTYEFNFRDYVPLISSYNDSIQYQLYDETFYNHLFDGSTMMQNADIFSFKKVLTTVDYIKIPLLLKLQREFIKEDKINIVTNEGFLYVGPSINIKIMDNTDLSDALENYFDNYDDLDSLTSYSSSKVSSSVDKIKTLQFDLVFGIGWKFNNVFGIGMGKDSYSIDIRNSINLHNVSDAKENNDIKFYTFNILVGYHF
jgi:hypothetical protein